MKLFWQAIHRPFFVLAPMENVTDTVFRRVVARCGAPEVFFTEFTNVDGLTSKGRNRVIHRLQFTEEEHPIIAQIWGNKPEHYFEAVKTIKELGFDGVDINMGCPERKIVSKGFCSGLIRNPALAKEIIQATKEAAGGLPVSVKTRIGYNKIVTEEWCGFLLSLGIDALTVHGRTAAEMSKVPAHWDEIGKVVKLRNQMKMNTVIVGNGDVKSREEGLEKAKQYGVDGIMIGRGVFDNLWIFNKNIRHEDVSYKDKMRLLIDHIKLFDTTWGKRKHYEILKKFYKIYVSGIPDATDFRTKLMECKTLESTIALLEERINR